MEGGEEIAFLPEAMILLLATAVVVPVVRRFGISAILGYLIAGTAIGPHGLAFIPDVEGTRALAELGVVFLLFTIGLGLSLERLRVMRRLVFGLGTTQVLVSGALLGAIAWFAGTGVEAAVVIGFSLALSSTAIVLQLLIERNEMAARHGRAAFAVLLFQDLAVVPLLVLVAQLGRPESSLGLALAMAFGKAVLAILVIVGLGRLLLGPLFRLIAASRSREVFLATVLLAVLATGWGTNAAGLSMALGAFLAGLLLAGTEYRHQIAADIEPFKDLLLGLFFITVGMSIDLSLLLARTPVLLGLLAVLLVVKGLVAAVLCRAVGMPLGTAVRTGVVLAQGGEFAFVSLGLAMRVEVIDAALAQLLLVTISLSMLLTPLLVVLGRVLDERLRRPEGPNTIDRLRADAGDLDHHVLIAGFGRVGQTVARLLSLYHIPWLALDLEPARVAEGRSRGLPVFFGDGSRVEVLRAAGGARAAAAVITLDNPQSAGRAVECLHQVNPDLRIFVRARDRRHGDALTRDGAHEVVLETLEASLQLAGRVLRAVDLSAEEVNRVIEQFRAEDYAALDDLLPAAAPSGADGQAGSTLDR